VLPARGTDLDVPIHTGKSASSIVGVTMPASYSVLQQPITISANAVQNRRDALEIGTQREVVVQATILTAAGAGTLTLEHAAVNQDLQFGAVGGSVDLTVAGPRTVVISGHLRYLRWKIAGLTGSVTFKLEVVSRS
jgi:hypothetical protein